MFKRERLDYEEKLILAGEVSSVSAEEFLLLLRSYRQVMALLAHAKGHIEGNLVYDVQHALTEYEKK